MSRTVEIRCDDQGQYSVGVEPEDQEQAGQEPGQAQEPQGATEGAGDQEDYLKPVKSLDDALSVARDLFQGTTGAQAQTAEKQFKAGFAGADQAQEAQGF